MIHPQDEGFGVMSDEVLRSLIEEQRVEHPLSKVVDQKPANESREPIEIADSAVSSLRVEYRGILKIRNLEPFTGLTKLQLCNNLIERIENLDKLVNLTCLDLSHNNIETIEGLDKLTKLEDLSLQRNVIKRLGGLDTLQRLEVLSLGDNQLSDLQHTVEYLRGLPALRATNLKGNPLCDSAEGEYPDRVIATAPRLVYLDWAVIQDEERDAAVVRFTKVVDRLEAAEAELRQKREKEEAAARVVEELVDDGVPEMDHSMWFGRLEPKLSAVGPLKTVPGFADKVKQLGLEFRRNSEPVREAGRALTSTRKQIVRDVEAALAEGTSVRLARDSLPLIGRWNQRKDDTVDEVESATGAGAAVKLEALLDSLDELKDQLIDVEFHLNNDLLMQIDEAHRDGLDAHRKFTEAVAAAFGDLRKAEEAWSENATQFFADFYDGYTRGAAPEGFTAGSDLLRLMPDKATLLGHITNIHDELSLAIDTKEDELQKIQTGRLDSHHETLADHERVRHRKAVLEISNFVNQQREQLEETMEDAG